MNHSPAVWTRHLAEIAEAQKIFDSRQADGVDIFDAAEDLPVPALNRRGSSSTQLRKLHQTPLSQTEISRFRHPLGKPAVNGAEAT